MLPSDPVALALLLGALALLPLAVAMTTSFLKISVVLVLVRNALGVQQAPPTIALNGIALAMTLFIMAPVAQDCFARYERIAAAPAGIELRGTVAEVQRLAPVLDPLREFLFRNSRGDERRLFVDAASRAWPPERARAIGERDWPVLIPAFVVSELLAAFEIGFLLAVPFVVIDLLVSNLLLALGMQMVSPMMLSLPLKILLFVILDGWGRLLHALVLSYQS
ncbi:type III secretion system export apparatus subunit SctR [Trinickia mobilis]|uniref:type III secretion system export apparatus subunit SctR n=1 Tax=Trinickia mobilis TaxID=2816356 RepID=UPI001A8C3201|nr:type III secretion system export apparatus subunit SctR [Trinickia mobilis]